MDRRTFLTLTGAGLVAVGAGVSFTGCEGLGDPDANGVRLLAGFTSRVVAVSGQKVAGTGYTWHNDPDGGATFPTGDGGWIYVSNSENVLGGVGMIRFASDGTIVDAKRILSGTIANCAGGATPWGTWLSCEEYDLGHVYECDPTGAAAGVQRPALGTFAHEAAACDPTGHAVYLTEDKPDGCFYRFRPTTWGDLSAGTLEVLTESGGTLGWATIPDPTALSGTLRTQVASAKHFNGGEGTVFVNGSVYFTTKGDNRVWRYTPGTNALAVFYDVATNSNPILSGVDNITARSTGDLYVAEDGGDMQIVRIRPGGAVSALLQVSGVSGSEMTGPAFSPDGTRLYFSSQRNPGTTYEVTGPF